MSSLGRVPPFRSKLDFELSSLEINILPSLDQTRVWFVQVEVDLGRGDGTCGVPSELDGFCSVNSSPESGSSVEISGG